MKVTPRDIRNRAMILTVQMWPEHHPVPVSKGKLRLNTEFWYCSTEEKADEAGGAWHKTPQGDPSKRILVYVTTPVKGGRRIVAAYYGHEGSAALRPCGSMGRYENWWKDPEDWRPNCDDPQFRQE